MTNMNKVAIYALADPRDSIVRYVGKTKYPARRLKSHINAAKQGGSRRKARWIRKLLKDGQLPKMTILEWTEAPRWESAEQEWISYYRNNGNDLVNHTDGGHGVHNPDTETRRRISEARKRMWKDDENFRERMTAVLRSPSRCRKISEALKGRSKSPKHIAKLPQNQKGYKQNLGEEARRAKSERMKGNTICKGKKLSEETKGKISKSLRGHKYPGRRPTPESNLKRSLTERGRTKSTEHKLKISKGLKHYWSTDYPQKPRAKPIRIEWPAYEWLEVQLGSRTIRQLADILNVKIGTLSGKLYRERKRKVNNEL